MQSITRQIVVTVLVILLLSTAGSVAATTEPDCKALSWVEEPAPAAAATYEVWSDYYLKHWLASEISYQRPAVAESWNRCYLIRVGGFTAHEATVLIAVFTQRHQASEETIKTLRRSLEDHVRWGNHHRHSTW